MSKRINMQYCIQKCIVTNVNAYYNKGIKINHILVLTKKEDIIWKSQWQF
ncbi:hypothetical protein C6359_27505 [Bacillus wiedmannii]|nr:hypothetical protein C6358_27470 [Bacillus wiedmannii]PRT39388.1 hypothetical protein C6359_27505 [Bacillus wiedmannii]